MPSLEERARPEIARALDSSGRVPLRRALTEWLAAAQASGLLGEGHADLMSEQFMSLLLGELQVRLTRSDRSGGDTRLRRQRLFSQK